MDNEKEIINGTLDYKASEMISSVIHSHEVIKKMFQLCDDKKKYDKHNKYTRYLLKNK